MSIRSPRRRRRTARSPARSARTFALPPCLAVGWFAGRATRSVAFEQCAFTRVIGRARTSPGAPLRVVSIRGLSAPRRNLRAPPHAHPRHRPRRRLARARRARRHRSRRPAPLASPPLRARARRCSPGRVHRGEPARDRPWPPRSPRRARSERVPHRRRVGRQARRAAAHPPRALSRRCAASSDVTALVQHAPHARAYRAVARTRASSRDRLRRPHRHPRRLHHHRRRSRRAARARGSGPARRPHSRAHHRLHRHDRGERRRCALGARACGSSHLVRHAAHAPSRQGVAVRARYRAAHGIRRVGKPHRHRARHGPGVDGQGLRGGSAAGHRQVRGDLRGSLERPRVRAL